MILDMKTIMLMYVIVNIVCAVVMAFVWYQNRKYFAGLSFWLADLILQAGGALLIVLRGTVPDFVSMVVANTMILVGIIVIYIGLERFVGQKSWQIHNYVLLAVFILIATYFTLVQPSLEERSLIISVMTAIFTFQCCWLLLHRVSPDARRTTAFVGIVFGGYTLVAVIRTIRFIIEPLQSNDFFKSGTFETLMITLYIILTICLICGLILMVNRRLLGNVRAGAEQIRRERDRAEAYFDMAGTMLLAVDAKGKVSAINQRGCEILEYEEKDIIGKDWFNDFTPERMRAGARSIFKKIMKGEIEHFEYVEGFAVLSKSGREKLVRWHNSIIKNERGKIVGILRSGEDVTERKRAEEKLTESEEKFRSLVESTSDWIWEINRDGVYTYASPKVKDLLGYEPEEVIGKTPFDLMPDEEAKRIANTFNDIIAAIKPIENLENTCHHKNGNLVTLETSGVPIFDSKGNFQGYRGVDRDITERKRAEEALKESEYKFRTFFEDAPMYCYMVSPEGKILDVNKLALETLGYKKEEVIGQPLLTTIYAPGSLEKAKTLFTKWKETGIVEGELNIITKEGMERTVLLSVHAVRDTRGKLLHSISIQSDVTELRRMEEERKILEQKAQLSSRLASIGELASGVAHEINNPLTGVIGYTQFLLDRKDIPDNVKDDLNIINEGAHRVASIVKRLLAFSRQTKPARTHVNINSLINDVLQMRAYHLQSNNITVDTALDSALPITIADAGQLQQVFLNIIVNAETEMKLAHNKGKLLISTRKSDNTIQVSFKDNGPGIPKDNLEKIFDPFFTTREVGEGAGLGLSICYGIVKEHNGRIWAESKPRQGATFNVELPIVTEAPVLRKSKEAN